MVGIRSSIEILQVTGRASRTQAYEDSRAVAGCTGHVDMRSRKRKRRFGVIEDCPRPACSAMTDGTVGRKTCSLMVRVIRLIESCDMT